MDETVIVLMLKDLKTGFLEKELGCYKITENDTYLNNIYAVSENGHLQVVVRLTCERELSDWEYQAVYDYYDIETVQPFVASIEEEENCFNPTWMVTFDFIDNTEEMEKKLSELLAFHKQELDSVYAAIADKRDEYEDYDQ